MSETVCKVCNVKVSNRELVQHLAQHNTTPQAYYDKYIGKTMCPVCGAETRFKDIFNGYNKYCSRACLNRSTIHTNSVKQTKLTRYGNPYYNNTEKIVNTLSAKTTEEKQKANQKRSQTKLERYGSETYNNHQKYEDTCLNLYGTTSPFASEEVKQKIADVYNAKSDVEKQEIYAKRQATLESKTPEERQQIGQKHRDAYLQKSETEKAEINNKIYRTKKKNHSFKVSKTEDLCYSQLLSVFPDAKHGYKSKEYPFVCDLYIPSQDLYIELNFHWTHGYHPYNPKKDKETLAIWKTKAETSQYFRNAIQTWTVRDVNKIKIAKKNKINLLVFYTKQDFDTWLSMQQCL